MRASADFELLEDQALIPRWCDWQFGIPKTVFSRHRFWHRPGTRSIWVADAQCEIDAFADPNAVGVIATRRPPPRAKPTSIFLQRFAAKATRNVYTLNREEVQRYLRRQTVTVTPVDDARGFCVVRSQHYVLGCGRIEGMELHSEVPRSWYAKIPENEFSGD